MTTRAANWLTSSRTAALTLRAYKRRNGLIYYGINPKRNGVAVAVDQQFRNQITDVSNISDRIISIKIVSGSITICVICCYAPQTGCTDEDKDELWENLDAHLRIVEPEEYLFIGGDLNGHVGSARHGYEQVHGGRGHGTRNDDGRRILDCAEAHDLQYANTFFKKRPTHLATYNSGGITTQIDYWMLRRRDLKLTLDTKGIPSDNIGPQHRPLILDVHLNLQRQPQAHKTGPERIKWWKWSEHKSQLAAAFGGLNINPCQPAEAMWSEITTQIHTIAIQILVHKSASIHHKSAPHGSGGLIKAF
ncbi:hypothetical protein PO909_012111 [Leuciscus waleckii]